MPTGEPTSVGPPSRSLPKASEKCQNRKQPNNLHPRTSSNTQIDKRFFLITHARHISPVTMSGEKRPASASFGTTQLVKRQRSEADMNNGALAKTNGANSGALVQGVSLPPLFKVLLPIRTKVYGEGMNI